ncbi:tetratricopeptide repeat protein [Sorangium atrum]|uniref:Tetratricopeptide repeat protein n=1 Tax=Sorangium atrum TaxID=2995308 RepID=A0ABT5BXF3_9BACT|nr:tetratricopeptide repeat protein [Sorangium aterium]MDC0678849.1 tetratricopeptide repeat protein [Sorangium aterium]
MVILVAITLEYKAALQVEEGALPESRWEQEEGPTGLPVAFRSFQGAGGRPLHIALAQAGDMGAVAATNALLPLVQEVRPRCVAMCGVCAGRPGKTKLGDVVAAERLFLHDTGKALPDGVQQDLRTYNLRDDWKVALEHADFSARFKNASWWKARPIPYEWQENWVLAKLHEGVADPGALSECDEMCPQWADVIASLWKSGHLHNGKLALTEEGRERIGRILIQQRGRFPDLSPAGALLPFKVHVAPMGSGNKVVEDQAYWSFVSEHMRKTLGLEMEAAALGALAHAQRDTRLDALVMKGVMDFANHGRDDHFKEYAARASAECLIAFLRDNLPPEAPNDPLDDLLVPGTSEPPVEASPAALLNARYQVVPFFGRADVLKEIHAWCDATAPVRARLFYGPAGIGKTRLFIEACAQLHRGGWRAGFIPGGVDKRQLEALMVAECPTFAVIDYAESRPDLRDLLEPAGRVRARKGRGRLRLVLLARNAGDWWTFLQGSDAELGGLLADHAPRAVPPGVAASPQRIEAFREAAESFAHKLGKAVPGAMPPLNDSRYDRVLYLHMAALATVEGREFTAETLMGSTLDHEQRFWSSRFPRADSFDARRFIEQMRRAVTALTLRGGASSRGEAAALVARIMDERDEKLVDQYLRFLRDLYPGQRRTSRTGDYLGGLEPDLLGEAMVHRTLSLEGGEADSYLDRVLERPAGEDALRTAFAVLGRLSEDQSEDGEQWLTHVLGRDVVGRAMVAFEAAKALGERTAHARLGSVLAKSLEREGTIDLAEQMARTGLPERTVSLREVALWAAQKRLEHLPEGIELERLAKRSRLLNNLGKMQSELGQREAALASAQEAVTIRRTLAEQQPSAFLPDLALGLNNLGKTLSELGQREAALASTQEAVTRYRTLAEQQPDAFLPYLALSLNNLGAMQSALGQWETALVATQEAVAIRRTLAERQPDAFLPYLALSLNNLGAMQSELGQREAALASIQESVTRHRTLAEQRPDAFLPDLAASFNNLGLMQSELGQQEAALASTQEAVTRYRTLAEQRPDAFLPDLAMSLNNLSKTLSELGQREAALASTQEAITHYRTLAEQRPDAFVPYLAASLNNLGLMQSELGQRAAALASTQEAVTHYRTLAEQRPDALLPDLAAILNNLGLMQSELGQREAALASTQKALDTIWPFFLDAPHAFAPKTSIILRRMLQIIEALGQSSSPELLERIALVERALPDQEL